MKYLIICLALGGCATGFVLDGTASTVSVNWAGSTTGRTGIAAAAEKHCAQFGKHAQFAGSINAYTESYNCVN